MIEVAVLPGTYVVAVSGGVDSMVLLDVLRHMSDLELIVAHLDHGIRPDSWQDKELVERFCMSHNIVFISEEVHLGPGASEEAARHARYDFLRRTCKKYNASAILTAHHQDDMLETAVINLLRGTGWRGLSSLRSSPGLIRPFLHLPKSALVSYAKQRGLVWREDSTNSDQTYLRNYVRQTILPRASAAWRDRTLCIIVRQNELTYQIEHEIEAWYAQHIQQITGAALLPRYDLIMMPQYVAHETLRHVLRRQSGKLSERPLVRSALIFCKVAKPGKVFQLDRHWQLRTTLREVIVEQRIGVVSLGNATASHRPQTLKKDRQLETETTQ